ncbi:MAG: nuclear transport factor 2 family protein [Sphingomicrobium sp.]
MRLLLVGLIAASMAAAPANAAADPLQARLVSMEKASWAAWQKMDVGFWSRFLSDDHIELNGYVGATGKKSVIDGIAGKACHVASYKVSDFTFRRFDARTAVLIYRAEQDTTCGAMKVPSPVWATSLYQLRGGRWVNVLYGHSPVLVPPKRPAS